jgi:uncharacterized phiE125 gp8 family phage protein
MSLTLITAPAAEPVTLAEAKLQCRIDGTELDAMLARYIAGARDAAEHKLGGRKLINQTWELALDAFPVAEIDLRLAPVASITSVKYIDVAGVEQTLASNAYTLDAATLPAWLLPAYGTEWPATLDTANAVKVRFVVGYGADGTTVPPKVVLWLLAHIGYSHAQQLMPDDHDSLLDGETIYRAL